MTTTETTTRANGHTLSSPLPFHPYPLAEQEAALPPTSTTRPKDRVADALTAVVAGSAAFSSWTGWVLLGHAAAWPKQGLPFGMSFDTAWLNPVSVDVLAYLGMRAWVSPHSPQRAQKWGRGAALGALGLSIVGNAVGHALESDKTLLPDRLPLVIALAAIAPIILVVVLHLRTLRNTPPEIQEATLPPVEQQEEDDPARTEQEEQETTLPPDQEDQEGPEGETVPNEEEPLLEAVRMLDEKYGRRVGVGRIKTELGMGYARAKRLRDAVDGKPE